jgi:hypothetical protein
LAATLGPMLRGGLARLGLGATQAAQAQETTTADGVLSGGLLLALTVVCVQTTAHLVDFGEYGLRLHALDSGLDTSVFAWVANVALGAAAVAATVIAVATHRAASAFLAGLLFVLLFAGLLDARERLPSALLLLTPVVAAILALLWRESHEAPPRAARFLRAAAVLLVVSFCLHVLGPPLLARLGVGAATWPFEIKVALKEGSEIAGWVIAATGLAATARTRLAEAHATGGSRSAA